jgi:L,D-peptidoglycan transpeptidase YkuD (ErfK/YbiS/YcfS/YnhG family)
MRRISATTTVLVAVAALCVTALAGASSPAATARASDSGSGRPGAATAVAVSTAAAGRPLPSYVAVPRRVRQMVTVTSRGWRTTHATLRLWRRPPGGRWRLARKPVHARIGYGGWVRGRARRQGTGTTPAGKYTMPRAFGSLGDPGTTLPYRRFDRNDFWPYEPRDPATYNIYQRHKAASTRWRTGYRERLWDYRSQYRHAVVLGFNLPRGVHYSRARRQWVARRHADTRRGGGIFLHVNGSGATAGCVSVGLPAMRRVVRWLDPQRHPRIAMGPRRFVRRL